MANTLPIESLHGHPDFRTLASIAGIGVDLRYASPHNFVGSDLYAPFDCAWIHREGAARLAQAVDALTTRRPDLHLVVLDALRPQRVQERLWARLEGTGLQIYLAPPSRGSIHSFGMAVDITLADREGRELDMGTPFDDLTELSHPVKEDEHVAQGKLKAEHVTNRRLLREVMQEAGWQGISREWWHFDGGDRERIRNEFVRVL
ncbi:M15 family metallopeptidase [Usitatibacter palustris]|uniref:D-alanyl-D-alanine dipeptidase n=1 Tax=Usitatibacter palustris TaxID=2732487 RepID=A0A6M4H5Q9_9PROT|nr:M15 family metallopeptidase [Usitatibacter palustris]QJR14632.1 D-alanyl-D-alanine dipeptidase [Usitatibacter palustris]